MVYEFKLPDIGEGIHEGEIVQWLVKPGDAILEDQPLLEVMTDKVTAEIPSPVSGLVSKTIGQAGEIIRVGAVVVEIETSDASTPSSRAIESTVSESTTDEASTATTTAVMSPPKNLSHSQEKVLAAPATRKLARTLGINIQHIAGTGPRGRVLASDLEKNPQNRLTQPPRPQQLTSTPSFSSAIPPNRLNEPVAQRDDRSVPFRGIRRKIAEHLVKSKRTAPHFAYVEEVDMTAVVDLRKQLKPEAERQGVKLTFLPFVMKAVMLGLQAYPVLNSTLDDATEQLIYKGNYNLGIAAATEDGLIVPVVHQADQYGLFGLARQVEDLGNRAKTGQLKPAEVSGGTFTLTSIGSIGGLFGVPIINYPEVAILGINKIVPRPVVRDGEIVIRDIMYLSIACDHRVVDGADAAKFMNVVVEALENPARLLWEAL